MRHCHKHGHEHGRGFGRFARGGRRFMEEMIEHRRRHGGGGSGGMGRFFQHGDLRLVILNLIAEKPRHGYEIIKAIEESAGGAYSPSPGVIYPTLTLLEELGYVTAEADGAKKLYTVTTEGKAYLKANKSTLDALLERISEASGHGRGRLPEVMRAMGNLKLALRLRLSQGDVTAAQVEAIAAAIDAAAAKVEKA